MKNKGDSKKKNTKKKLTLAQKAFCIEYSKNGFNRTKAAQKAYPNQTYQSARETGHRLLADADFSHVREYANSLVNAELESLGVNRESILRELAKVGFCELPEVTVSGQDIHVKKSVETLAQELEFQSGMKGDKVKFKAPDKVKALQALDDIRRKHQTDDDDSDTLTIIRVGK